MSECNLKAVLRLSGVALAVVLLSAVSVATALAHGKPVPCTADGAVLEQPPHELRVCFNERIDGAVSDQFMARLKASLETWTEGINDDIVS